MLRPYQQAAVSAVRGHWAAGRLRICCTLPTGAGKTVVAAALLAGARAPLAIVHTDTLRSQTRRRLGPGVRVETVQGLLSRGKPINADVVFWDECHHAVSDQWRRTLALLPRDVHIVGCTATPERADGTPLGDIFQALVCTASYSTLLAGGWLAPARVVPTAGMDPAAAYLAHGQRRPGILFAPTIVECRAAVDVLRARGVRAACLDSTVPDGVRAALVAAFEAGGLDLLASPMALAEGFDSPRAAVCVLDRTCVHSGTYLQVANRVTRPHASKTSATPALLLDCSGASERHGHPTEDRIYSLSGTGIRRAPRPVAATASRPTPAPRSETRPVLSRAPVVARIRSAVPPLPRTPHAAGRTIGAMLRAWWLRVA